MLHKTLQITDQDLLRKIKTSVLADDQKRELEALLPEMTEGEQRELSALIDKSVQDMIKADPELQKKIVALNEEYDQKLQELVHEQNRTVRQEFEKLEKDSEAGAVKDLEGEMEHADGVSRVALTATNSGEGLPRKHKHGFIKLLVILLALLALTGGVLFALQSL
ncbi:MAG: hypothetical protein V1760_03050 [Candidatus Peregrinibacteria bacterium]